MKSSPPEPLDSFVSEALLGDMYLRLERLEAEVRTLRRAPEPLAPPPTAPVTPVTPFAPFASGQTHDGTDVETKLIAEVHRATPPTIGWPTRLTDWRDTPMPAERPDPPAREPATLSAAEADALLSLGRAAAGLAHDFNNMLAVIQGFGELLREQLPAGAAPGPRAEEWGEWREMAATIAATAELGGGMCRQMMGVAWPEAGTPPRADFNPLVRRVARLLRSIAGAKVAVTLDLAEGLPEGRVPSGELFQVLLNLTTNAADAMRPHGGRLTVRTRAEVVPPGQPDWPQTLPPGRYVVLSVTDSGPGVDAAILGRLLSAGVTTRPGAHRGLGLATVEAILARHAAHLALETDPAWGTSFRAYFHEA